MRTQTTSRCLIIKDDTIILCKHIADNYYFLPGGGVELGETLDECIFREIKEEMGVNEKDVRIHEGIILAIENQMKDSEGKLICDKNGRPFYGIELVKKVDIMADTIKSQENHIGFEAVKISELKNIVLYPETIKKWAIKILDKKDN